MKRCKSSGLFEIDQSVKDGNDVVDAENEGIEYTGRAQLQPAM